MNMMVEKIELVKQLLNTNDIDIIESINILFDSTQNSDHRANLPTEELQTLEAIRQIEAGQGISHLEARETYKKWL